MLRTRVLPPGFIRPCQPSPVATPPAGRDWFHEIKHDGIRLLVRREGERVRAFTRNGNDWATRYPAIAASAAGLKARSFLIDAEAVVADGAGLASFELLRGRTRHGQAFCWAFDLLELDGQDLRQEPLERRKDALARLLKRAPFGLALNEHHAGDGPALFAAACEKGLEGIVSKRAGSRYSSGPSPHWLKAKNPASAAAQREAIGRIGVRDDECERSRGAHFDIKVDVGFMRNRRVNSRVLFPLASSDFCKGSDGSPRDARWIKGCRRVPSQWRR